MHKIIFETPRLICRHLDSEDMAAMLEVYGDAEAMRYVGDGSMLTKQEAQEWITVTEHNYKKRGYGMFALVECSTQQVIGFCGIVHPDGQVEPEVKYAFLRTHWGKGLATEAIAELIDYGERVHGLKHIIATVAPEHLASQKVLGKVGMYKTELRIEEDGAETQVFEWRKP